MRPVVALLTDFGAQDHYAGTMKGVMLGICPEATLVDISHEVPAHDVLAGALELAAAYRYFPVGTIFLVVVDPGVGSARRGLVVRTGGYTFVAPDNGVLTTVIEECPPAVIVELTEPRYARQAVSRTFEGRDRFAPAAAWLATGADITTFGPSVSAVTRLAIAKPVVGPDGIAGQVLRIDRFGNLVTNIDRETFERVAGPRPTVQIGACLVTKMVSTYAEVAAGAVCALFSSTDHLEIAANGTSAARALDVERGTPVHVARSA